MVSRFVHAHREATSPPVFGLTKSGLPFASQRSSAFTALSPTGTSALAIPFSRSRAEASPRAASRAARRFPPRAGRWRRASPAWRGPQAERRSSRDSRESRRSTLGLCAGNISVRRHPVRSDRARRRDRGRFKFSRLRGGKIRAVADDDDFHRGGRQAASWPAARAQIGSGCVP